MLQRSMSGRGHKGPGKYLAASVPLLLILVLVALAACGTSPTSTTSGGQPQATSTPQVQQCGKVSALGVQLPQNQRASSQQAEACFMQAFQHCQAATLTYSANGVDSGAIHTFTITNKNGKCAITDATQHYVLPGKPRDGGTFTCTGVKSVAGEVTVTGCGQEGDVQIPAPVFTSP